MTLLSSLMRSFSASILTSRETGPARAITPSFRKTLITLAIEP